MSSNATRLLYTPKALKEFAVNIITTNISCDNSLSRLLKKCLKKELPARDLAFFTNVEHAVRNQILDIVVYTLFKKFSEKLLISYDVLCKY